MIILACVQVGRLGYATIAIIGSILTLAALLKVQKVAFFGKVSQLAQTAKEVPGVMLASMLALALICLGVSVDLSNKTPEFIDLTFTAVIVAKSNVKEYAAWF